MKKQVKNFLLRGTFFAGSGPIIYAIIMLSLELSGVDTNLNGLVVFSGVISTYILAFIVAGVSIIWQEERIGLAFKIAIHGSALYITYLITYLINGWIASNWLSLVIFSIIFIAGYGIVWLIIYLIEKHHKHKKDFPSGTSKTIKEIINYPINILEIKSGEIIGTHELDIYFENERLSLFHEAFSRRAFVDGVIQAVNIIKTLPIGLYNRENLNLWKETK